MMLNIDENMVLGFASGYVYLHLRFDLFQYHTA